MTRSEFVEVYRRQYGYEPTHDELELLMDEYHVDEDDYGSQPSRPSGRVYNFSGNQYFKGSNSKAVTDLIGEVKSIFEDISGMSKRSAENKTKQDNTGEFTYMAMTFLCKSALYFLLKSAHTQGYEGVNL